MKKRLALLMATVLLCLLTACAGETKQPADTTTATTATTTQPADTTTTTTATTTQPADTTTTTTATTTQPADTTTTTTATTAHPADTTTTTTATTTQPSASPTDYTVFCGNYSDTETVEGPCYTVSILHVDNATKAIEISIFYVGVNASPLYMAESIHASIAGDHTVPFEWKDSWQNQGVGTLVLDPDDPSTVQLMMTVTEEAEVNRATLSTNGRYKTLMRQ